MHVTASRKSLRTATALTALATLGFAGAAEANHPAGEGGGTPANGVVRVNKGYTLYSLRTGGPVARLRPTGQGGRVQVLWWRREAWGNPGPFGREVMPLDEALEFIATEGFFWIHAS